MKRTADPALFKTPHRRSAVETVIDKIKQLLVSRHLKPGDRLPNEIELTRSFSASRGSIREAMKILEAFGIVEIKRGDGTYVSTSPATAFDHILFSLIMSDSDKRKLMEFRELIESGIAKFILSNADDQDIRNIEAEYNRMEALINSGMADSATLTECDLAFHQTLGRATKNELIERIYSFTLDLFAPSIQKTHQHPDSGGVALHIHKGILEGIRNRNPEQIRAAVLDSIDVWIRRSSEEVSEIGDTQS